MMPGLFDISKMLAGVAFFLLAMDMMESTLHQLVGRRFKLFLRKQTNNKWKAIGGAAIVTGFLQSSSIVNLLVLSMVGAGVVQMENALALILGANLGTTLDSWLVATIGFDLNIERLIFPLVGISGIWMMFGKKENKLGLLIKFIFSFGFLFVALGFIKSGMEAWVKQTDLTAFIQYPSIVFLLIGILLTAIIQSSSATIALTLSALHANGISLFTATAIVLGSEIGTTFKLFLASAKGSPVKKRVALGNFLFNAATVFFIFILLRPINEFVSTIIGTKNSLISLVFFQTLVNVICMILFFPFLTALGKYLMKRFKEEDEEINFINKICFMETTEAILALDEATNDFIEFVIQFSLLSFDTKLDKHYFILRGSQFDGKSLEGKYDYIKSLYGKLHAFYLQLQQKNLTKTVLETERLEQLMFSLRNLMYAAKNIKNAEHDIVQMHSSSNDVKYNFYLHGQQQLFSIYPQLISMLQNVGKSNNYADLCLIYQSLVIEYPKILHTFYNAFNEKRINENEMTTLINFSRELYASLKSVVLSIKEYILSKEEIEKFDSLAEFII
jgi:phosphate:Na+ symporter